MVLWVPNTDYPVYINDFGYHISGTRVVAETKTQECMSISVPQYPIIFQKNTRKNIKTTILQKCYPKNSHFRLKNLSYSNIYSITKHITSKNTPKYLRLSIKLNLSRYHIVVLLNPVYIRLKTELPFFGTTSKNSLVPEIPVYIRDFSFGTQGTT